MGLVPLAMFSMTEILSMFPSDGLTISIDIVNVKVQPLFLPSDFTLIFPPFYLTKFWQIMSPRPTPSGFKVPVPSKLESLLSLPKRWKSYVSFSGSIPFPVSMIATFNFFLSKL